jgi:hypothetical protein
MACIADRAAWRSEIFRPDVADISLGDLTSASSGACRAGRRESSDAAPRAGLLDRGGDRLHELTPAPVGDRRGQPQQDIHLFVGQMQWRWHRASSSGRALATMTPCALRLQGVDIGRPNLPAVGSGEHGAPHCDPVVDGHKSFEQRSNVAFARRNRDCTIVARVSMFPALTFL